MKKDIIAINEQDLFKVKKNEKIKIVENLFNNNIKLSFREIVGDNYNKQPLSLIISFNHHQDEGMATIRFRKNAKTLLNSVEVIQCKINKMNYKGVDL